MTRQVLSLVVTLAGSGGYRFAHVAAPIPQPWRTAGVGATVRHAGGREGTVAYLFVERAQPPLGEPVLVPSVAEWEATGATLPRGREMEQDGAFADRFARREQPQPSKARSAGWLGSPK